jgi:hypothetical protein
MTTKTVDCATAETQMRERKCIPCEIGVFCRNHYYRGKLLTERDFFDEQKYTADKARLHNLALHGWGVVCGLGVRPHERCPELRLVVSTGLGIDCCGREIRILKPVEIALPQPPPRRIEEPCPEDEPAPRTHQGDDGEYHVDEQDKREPHKEPSEGDDEDHPEPYNPCDDTPEPIDLYVCIRYLECETEFSPAPFDDCNCNANGEQPNRICEGYKVELYDTKPKFWDKAVESDCEGEDCDKFYVEGLRECQSPCAFPCLPLAVIRNFVPGKAVGHHQIDHSPRRQLATTATLDRVLRCVLGKLPTQEMTHIVDINWEHGERFLCHHFMNDFVGSEKYPKGFEIRFDSKVYSRSIDTRSFQALVIYRPDSLAEPRHMEIAPAHIETEEHESTEWCRLRIDFNYARKHLDGRNFDLFLTLKCNVITGKNGLAVDGNFLATREHDDVYRMVFPSGDNIAGGTFESWIRVRPRPK